MKIFRSLLPTIVLLATAFAQTTRTWQQSKYDEFEKGTAHGIAIASDGELTLAPSFTAVYTTPSTYLWDVASDADGNIYAAAGSPARVYKLTPDGKAHIIFAPQELQVQSIVVDSSGAIYAATSPDGKVYKLVHGGPAPGKTPEGSHTTAEVAAAQEGAKPGEKARPSVEVDPSYSASVYFDPKTKYIWALALDREGQLYIGTGRSRRDLPRRSQRQRQSVLQERRGADSRARLRQSGQPHRRHRWQRVDLSHLARRSGLRALQRAEEGDHGARG